MPPVNDNILGATVLVADGAPHTITVNNVGATFETNEASCGEGEESIWLTFDLSGFGGGDVDVTFSARAPSHDINPFLDVWWVVDAGFDPASPDFCTGIGALGLFYGDGSDDWGPQTRAIDSSLSVTGVFYVFVGDNDFIGADGDIEITYTIGTGGGGDANETCATATMLVGSSGSFVFDNQDTQTWESPDPLFTWAGEGGGAPRWYQTTNPSPSKAYLRVFLDDGPDTSMPKVNAAILRGAGCGSLAVDTDTTHTLLDTARDNATPAPSLEIAQLADGGETVWIEIDGYSGDVSDPPTLASGDRGKLTVTWEWVAANLLDGVSTNPIIVTDIDGAGVTLVPYDSRIFDDRIFTTWRRNDGTYLYERVTHVSDCALDGSDLHVTALPKTSGSTLVIPSGIDPGASASPAQLAFDGEHVFIGWAEIWAGVNPNYGCAHTDPGDTQDAALWYFHVFRWDAATHGWDEWAEISGGGELLVSSLYFKFTASVAEPGVGYVIWSNFSRTFVTHEEHVGTPPFDFFECITDINDSGDVTNAYKIDLSRNDTAFGTIGGGYEFLFEGASQPNLTTNFELVCDDGTPILIIQNAEAGSTYVARTWEDVLSVYQLDPAASPVLLQTISYEDVSGVSGTDYAPDLVEDQSNSMLTTRAGARAFNVDTGEYERLLVTFWSSPTLPDVAFVNPIRSDFSAPPGPLLGSFTLSKESLFGTNFFSINASLDGGRNVWAIDDNADVYQIALRCAADADHWIHAYDNATLETLGAQRGDWDSGVFYYLTDEAEIRTIPIDRNALICSVGDTPISGETVGIHTTHRMIGIA